MSSPDMQQRRVHVDAESQEAAQSPAHADGAPRWRNPIGVTVLLCAHMALLAWSASVHSPTLDEPFHLAAGVRRWTTGQFDIDRGTPPLVSSLAALPVVASGARTDWRRVPNSFQVGSDFLKANGPRSFGLMTAARWMLLPLSALGGLVCFLWARDLWGVRAGYLALVLWTTCPQVLAFGALVTGDMAAATFGTAAMYAFWKWLREPRWSRAINAGVLLGLAEVAKLVSLVLYPLCLAIWLAWRWLEAPAYRTWRATRGQLAQGLLIVVLSIDVINMVYVFAGFGTPAREFLAGQRVLAWTGGTPEHPTMLGRWLGAIPLPFPADYVRGLDEVVAIVAGAPPSYLRGIYREGGWWFYYLYGWLVKLPLGFWAVILLAAVSACMPRGRSSSRGNGRGAELLLVVSAAILVFVTYKSGMQFLRYSLPALPFVLIYASRVAVRDPGRPPIFDALVLGAVLWGSASSLLVYPHSLSYFNALAGGSQNGARHLLDDSHDWGQDLLVLRRWLDAHPEAKPLRLAYLGWTDPRTAGIEFQLPPRRSELLDADGGERAGARSTTAQLVPGWYAVSTGISHGTPFIPIHDGAGNEVALAAGDFVYFRDVPPVSRAGYSIRIYRLDEEAVAEIWRGLRRQ